MVHLARGMRDFLPPVMRRRRWVLEQVRAAFERYGFEPLETPALERLDTLLGKCGDEGDRLLFQVLRRGEGAERGETDLGLRYDLTVPLARVMAMNQDLPLPFRRYQLQPVWRADRPQRGRFREFLQCDVDAVGSTSPVADAECLAVVHDSLCALGFSNFRIRLNHRQLLRAMAAHMGVPQLEGGVLVALDKLDKIGREGVSGELLERGVPAEAAATLWRLLDLAPVEGDPEEGLAALGAALGAPVTDAVENLRQVLSCASELGVNPAILRFDPTLARGLDYYTGAVFETVVLEPAIGSISGGGRYDGLVGMFSGKPLPAVGVSLGIERILVVMEELGMLPELGSGLDAAVFAMEEAQLPAAMRAAAALRAAGLAALLAPEPARFKKAMKAADRLSVPWVLLVGPDEDAAGQVTLRQASTRAQEALSLEAAVARVKGA
ncbi:MAG: histidine--tRNA ligase [Pseudomonadota bacterium]